MSKSSNAVKITILDKDYLVSCTDDEKDALDASVKHLSQKMSEIRSGGKVVGIDRIHHSPSHMVPEPFLQTHHIPPEGSTPPVGRDAAPVLR